MKKQELEEEFFQEIMSKSKLNVPFLDFDNHVMGIIEHQVLKKTSISKEIKLSWAFFILGSIVGVILAVLLLRSEGMIMGVSFDKLVIPFLIVCSFLILSQFDILLDFYRRQKVKTKR
ncbi:MAG: hypothetical protein ABR927_15140 [Bacteroidales bacterium]|jgi:hypothetical protein